jgi:hypothetical protein
MGFAFVLILAGAVCAAAENKQASKRWVSRAALWGSHRSRRCSVTCWPWPCLICLWLWPVKGSNQVRWQPYLSRTGLVGGLGSTFPPI